MISVRAVSLAAACVFAPVGFVVAGESKSDATLASALQPRRASNAGAVSTKPARGAPAELKSEPEGFMGLLLPRESADVGALVAGKLIAVHVRMGDRVRAGEPIATLDARLADADVAAAEAAVRSQEVEGALAQGAQTAAQAREQRVRSLTEHGLAPGEELLEASEESERAKLRVRASGSLLSQKLAQLQRLSLERHLMQVRAPFAGVVAARYLDPGAAVALAGARPIVRVISEAMLLRVALPEAQAGSLVPGALLRAISATGELSVTARVERVAAEVDPVARVWIIEAGVEASPLANTQHLPSQLTAGLVMRVQAIVSVPP